jgi:hypothetical protein
MKIVRIIGTADIGKRVWLRNRHTDKITDVVVKRIDGDWALLRYERSARWASRHDFEIISEELNP